MTRAELRDRGEGAEPQLHPVGGALGSLGERVGARAVYLGRGRAGGLAPSSFEPLMVIPSLEQSFFLMPKNIIPVLLTFSHQEYNQEVG